MSAGASIRHAVLIGAEQSFGAEIAARIEADGFAVATLLEGETPLDLLVLNAPVRLAETRFREITDAAFLAALEAQLFAPVAAVQAAASRLRDGASIVFVASRAHLGGWAGADVIAAGGALIGIARSMALEFAGRAIRVNVLAPDYAEAPWDTPAARAEVAGAVAWLAGPDSAAVSGETILLDRGRTLRMSESAQR